jgi:hypothetical protein
MLLEEPFGFAQTLLSEDNRSRLVGTSTSVENAEQLIWHRLAQHELVRGEIQVSLKLKSGFDSRGGTSRKEGCALNLVLACGLAHFDNCFRADRSNQSRSAR